MRKILFSLFIIVGLLNCEKESQISKGLIGTWEWISTDGGLFPIRESPSTTGNTFLLKFVDDKKIVIYGNDIEFFSGNYTIEKENSIYSGELEDYIRIDGDCQIHYLVINGIIKIGDNFLTISDNCYDGFGSSYKRID